MTTILPCNSITSIPSYKLVSLRQVPSFKDNPQINEYRYSEKLLVKQKNITTYNKTLYITFAILLIFVLLICLYIFFYIYNLGKSEKLIIIICIMICVFIAIVFCIVQYKNTVKENADILKKLSLLTVDKTKCTHQGVTYINGYKSNGYKSST